MDLVRQRRRPHRERSRPDPAAAAARRGRPAAARRPRRARRRGLYPWTPLGRAGFGVAAVGGILTAATAGSTAVEQEPFGYIEVAGGSWIGVVAAVLGVAAAAAPWPWARLTGVAITSLFALLVSFALIGFRTSDDLVAGVDVTLGPAGWLMLVGALLLFAGTALALIGLRRPAKAPDPSLDPKDGKAVASLVLGIVGVIIPVTAAPAIGLGLFAMDDVRVTGGRIGGPRAGGRRVRARDRVAQPLGAGSPPGDAARPALSRGRRRSIVARQSIRPSSHSTANSATSPSAMGTGPDPVAQAVGELVGRRAGDGHAEPERHEPPREARRRTPAPG